MVKILYRTLLFLSILWLSACDSVFVQQPLGDEVMLLDQGLWQGQWSNGEMVIITTIIDAEKGILQAAWIERGEHGAQLEMATGYVRKSGDLIYLNLPNLDRKETEVAKSPVTSAPEYNWARLVVDEHSATMWWPNQNRFRDAVKAGTLPGIIKEDQDVVLDELSSAHLQIINSPEANLLSWTEPLVFVRIAD